MRRLLRALLIIAVVFPTLILAESTVLHPVSEEVPAPDFVLKDINGDVHHLSGYRGKVLIVNFWATWCPPCRFELPSMERLWQKTHDQGVAMLAINLGEDEDTIFTFTSDYPVSFPLLLDRDSSVTREFSVLGIPTSFIIDTQGNIRYKVVGTREWDDEQVVNAVLELTKPK
ncbi:peroxiredoxin family protein [Kaarinaea lacus]